MGFDVVSYALSKKYTDDTANALGSLKGAPCSVKSIEAVDGGNRITFAWEGTDGTEQTDYVIIPNGVDGEKGERGEKGETGPKGDKGDPGQGVLPEGGSPDDALTIDADGSPAWTPAPWRSLTDSAGNFSIGVFRTDNISLVEYLKKVPLGVYTVYVEKGCPNNPEQSVVINSSLRGIVNVNTDFGEWYYAWIILFDQESHCYVQYVRSGVGSGWIQIDKGCDIDNTLTRSGAAADAKTTGDMIAALSDEIEELKQKINATA